MDDPFSLCVGILLGAIGSGIFVFGMKQKRGVFLLVGFAMGFIPFIVTNGWGQLGIGAAMCGLLVWACRAGIG